MQASKQTIVWIWKPCAVKCRFHNCGYCCSCLSWSWPLFV